MNTSLEESYTYCKSLSRKSAGNFHFSFLTLPADLFRDMCVLYAFMRLSDDLGDDETLPALDRLQQLTNWRKSLQSALAGDRFDHEVFPALAEIVRKYDIPHEYFFAVLDGVQADLEPGGFETFEELTQYCYQVAGAVGLCCIHIWGFHDERALMRAVDCGIAFQLTNILRDLGEDARMGRCYLPREDLKRFDYGEDEIAAGLRDERFFALMQFEVERTRSYYHRAEELFAYLDPPGQPIYSAMLKIYGGLLEKIERSDYDVYSRRIQLPRWRKLMISLESIVRHRWLGRTGGRRVES